MDQDVKWIKRKRNLILHMIMAFSGGCTGIYAIMMRGNFGQAQTANLIDLVIHWVVGDDLWQVVYRFGALGVFALALGISHELERRSKREINELTSFLVNLCCGLIAGLIPGDAPEIPALYPVFFMTGFQWGIFAGADGFNCSTIFCTNNTKQALFGWMDFIHDHRERSFEQGRFYTVTIGFFYGGATATAFLAKLIQYHAIWITWIPALAGLFVWLVTGSLKREEEEKFTKGPQNIRRGTSEL